MRIGIYASYLGRPVKTGVEVFAEEVIRRLLEHREHEFVLIRGEGIDDLSGENVRRLPVKSHSKLLPLLGEMGRAVRKERLDTLFYPTQYTHFGRNPDTVSVGFDVAWRYFPEYFPASKRIAFELLTRNMVAKTRRIVAISRATKDDLVCLYGADPERVDVVHLGYDPERYHTGDEPDDREVLSRYGLEKGGYILYLGTLQKRKNIIGLVRAYEECGTRLPLILAGGDGWFHGEIEAAIAGSRRRDSIRRTGYVEEGDKAALYRGCTAFAYPSLYEGFGLPVLEAMACGCKVVTSNVSSMPEVIGDAGFAVAPDDTGAIARAIEACEGESTRGLGGRAAERAKLFSWDGAAEKILAAIVG